MKSLVRSMVGLVATVLALAKRAAGPAARAVARLNTLASVRARVSGRIPASTQFDRRVQVKRGSRVNLGESCRLGDGAYLETNGAGSIRIGNHVRINAGTFVVSDHRITIGDDCLIGEYCSIRDANHGMEAGSPMRVQAQTGAPISIGDDVWLGRGSVVLAGVTIGSGAVVGANSVVTRDVPARAVAVGSPARIVRSREG